MFEQLENTTDRPSASFDKVILSQGTCTGRRHQRSSGWLVFIFCVSFLLGYSLPWEDSSFVYPSNFALPVEIAVEASNGASDYGNKFGEPVLAGFARSFGMEISAGDRREYVKPIMFSAGIGQLEGSHIKKKEPLKGRATVWSNIENGFGQSWRL